MSRPLPVSAAVSACRSLPLHTCGRRPLSLSSIESSRTILGEIVANKPQQFRHHEVVRALRAAAAAGVRNPDARTEPFLSSATVSRTRGLP
jgi:hypothetical protein